MAIVQSGTSVLANRIPEIWSPLIYEKLLADVMFLNFFETKYQAGLSFGDTINVQTINEPTGEVLTDDLAAFSSEAMSVTNQAITVTKRASASFVISDLAKLQALEFQAQAVDKLTYAVRKQFESAIIAALIPSAAAPDHDISPAAPSDLAGEDVVRMATLLSESYVPVSERGLFLAPSYMGDLKSKTGVMSRDFVTANSAQTGAINQYAGFDIMEHNLLSADVGFACHKSAMQLVVQQGVRVQISPRHAVNYYDFVVSADMVFGLKLMDNKRIVKISG